MDYRRKTLQKPCKFGKGCNNALCSFYHGVSVCKFFNTSFGCKNDDTCPFKHVSTLQVPNAPKKSHPPQRMDIKKVPIPSLDNSLFMTPTKCPDAPMKQGTQSRITSESQPIPFGLNRYGTHFSDESYEFDDSEDGSENNSQEEEEFKTDDFGEDYYINLGEYTHY